MLQAQWVWGSKAFRFFALAYEFRILKLFWSLVAFLSVPFTSLASVKSGNFFS